MADQSVFQQRVRFLLVFFMCALMLSGVTAIPLQWELKLLTPLVQNGSPLRLVRCEIRKVANEL